MDCVGTSSHWYVSPIAGDHSVFRGSPLDLGLTHLVRRKIESFLIGDYGFPGQVSSDALLQVLQSGVVSSQESKGVPEQARSIASRFQYGLGGGDCATVGCSFPCMGVTGTNHHQTRIKIVLDFMSRRGKDVDAIEISTATKVWLPVAF